MLLGAAGITVGNWIKAFSVAPDRFYMAFIGQCFSVSFLMLTFGLLGRFTATWFGAKEIATAGVLAILGDQVSVPQYCSNGNFFSILDPFPFITFDFSARFSIRLFFPKRSGEGWS